MLELNETIARKVLDTVDAAAAYAADAAKRDFILGVCAEIGLQALITLKSPGCEYLWLCDAP